MDSGPFKGHVPKDLVAEAIERRRSYLQRVDKRADAIRAQLGGARSL
jgi:predicted transcriptional regulator